MMALLPVGQSKIAKKSKMYTIKTGENLNKIAEIFNCSPKDFWPDKPL